MTVKYERIKKRIDFEKIFKTGKTTIGRFVFLKAKKTENKNCRLCFVVGLKVSKKAVERNKTKRRIREIMRSLYLELKPNYDIVVIAKQEILNKKYTDIKDEIIKTIKSAKLFK
ncbi:MAG: ribonuclease P protein component [bacterium]|nr:ribonuclease P protein component [bacterium]